MFTGNPGPSFLIPTSWMILNTTFNHLWFLSKGNRRVGLGSPLSLFSSWGKNYVWSPLLFLYCLSHTKQESKHEYTFVNIELRSFPANGNQYIEAHNGFLIGRYLQSPQHCQILLSLPQDHSRKSCLSISVHTSVLFPWYLLHWWSSRPGRKTWLL